jgi:hypothetical protein
VPSRSSLAATRRLARPEPATAEVERAEVVFEVDVEPLAPGGASVFRRDRDEPGSHPLAPYPCCDEGVEDERIDAAVPGNVDEADQVESFPGADLTQTVLVHLSPPVAFEDLVAEALRAQGVERGIAERAAPFVSDHLANVGKKRTGRDPVSRPAGQIPKRAGLEPRTRRRALGRRSDHARHAAEPDVRPAGAAA